MGIVPLRRMSGDAVDREPTAGELAAIEAEWPQIADELAQLDAEIACLVGRDQVCELDRRRVRREQRRALVARRLLVAGSDSAGVA